MTSATGDEHNASLQPHVIPNDDPALDRAHEHHHTHLHHDANAEKRREDEVVYSKGTTNEKSTIPHQDHQDHDLSRRKHTDISKGTPIASDSLADAEQGGSASEELDPQTHTASNLYRKYRLFFHLFIWLVFTGWWIAGLVIHGIHDSTGSRTGWLKAFLVWFAITLRIIFFHVPITIVTRPMHWAWRNTGVRFSELIPEKLKIPAGALLVIAVLLIGGFASPESLDNTRDNRAVSLFGLAVIIFVMWATSRNRKAIKWHTVIVGMFIQFIIALFVLRSGAGCRSFYLISIGCIG